MSALGLYVRHMSEPCPRLPGTRIRSPRVPEDALEKRERWKTGERWGQMGGNGGKWGEMGNHHKTMTEVV